MSPWTGARIICLGDECESSDWSTSLLTIEEKNVINEGLDEAKVNSDEDFS
jgi:hypothetical protein